MIGCEGCLTTRGSIRGQRDDHRTPNADRSSLRTAYLTERRLRTRLNGDCVPDWAATAHGRSLRTAHVLRTRTGHPQPERNTGTAGGTATAVAVADALMQPCA